MYHHFFGLQEPAFAIAVNPRYLYMSEQHREALAHLLFGLQGGGFVQLTGEVGTGKTTIIRCLLEQLPDETDIALVLNPMASVPELLSSICDELGARYIADKPTLKTLTDALYNRLLDNHMMGRNTVLLIDEAQSLSTEALEQVRLLTNLETNTEKLLNIILVGQPELNEILAQPRLRQLSQRITARFHLQPLTAMETQAYIQHRLQVAGLEPGRVLIPPSLVDEVHQFSGGIPRLINIICERMLLGAYGQDRPQLDSEIFRQARREVVGADAASETTAQSIKTDNRNAKSRSVPELIRLRFNHLGLRQPWHYSLMAGIVGLGLGALLFWLLGGTAPAKERSLAAPPVASMPATNENALPPAAEFNSGLNTESQPVPDLINRAQAAEPKSSAAAYSSKADIWPWELEHAQRTLAEHLGLAVADEGSPCTEDGAEGYYCERQKMETWNDLMDLERPAVLTLLTPERKRVYAPLLGLNQTDALVLIEDEPERRPWRDLALLWNGEVHYYSFRPSEFDDALKAGDRGPAVTWLAQQFAQLDGERKPLATDRYNLALQSRVEIFQRQQQLEPDGIFGLNTLKHLNRTLGLDPALVNPDLPMERD